MFSLRPAAKQSTEPLEPTLLVEIHRYLGARYAHRVESKLAGRFPVNLRIVPSDKGTSEEGKARLITVQDEHIGREIGEIFDRAHGRLLIVGLPGAGKTTLLLQIALELLKRAESVPAALAAGNPSAKAAGTIAHPIPVLLNLATWRSEFVTFDEWLKRILPNELGATKALSEKIRTNMTLILLLDGLDEVPDEDRNTCLKALGQYGMKPENQYVISSRILEYAAAKDAPVYAQVEVAPLSAEQIEMNLIAYAAHTPEAKPLLHAIQKDQLLKQAIENPFYLNTAQLLFASGKGWSEFGFVAGDVIGRREELVERFVEYALTNKAKRDYVPEKAKKWLGFLAVKMEFKKQLRFELAGIQPEWLSSNFFPALLQGLLMYPIFFILPRFSFSYNYASIVEKIILSIGALIFSFMIAFKSVADYNTMTIKTRGKRKWSFSKSIKNLKNYLGVILLTGFISFAISFLFESSLEKSIVYGGVISALAFILTIVSSYEFEEVLLIGSPYQRFMTEFWSIQFWNINFALIGHIAIRLCLSFESSLPLRLVHFLNEMSRRHLLEFDGNLDTETGGGAWRWRHRIIQEYFLNKSDKKEIE